MDSPLRRPRCRDGRETPCVVSVCSPWNPLRSVGKQQTALCSAIGRIPRAEAIRYTDTCDAPPSGLCLVFTRNAGSGRAGNLTFSLHCRYSTRQSISNVPRTARGIDGGSTGQPAAASSGGTLTTPCSIGGIATQSSEASKNCGSIS